jgi:hypothetical protein
MQGLLLISSLTQDSRDTVCLEELASLPPTAHLCCKETPPGVAVSLWSDDLGKP